MAIQSITARITQIANDKDYKMLSVPLKKDYGIAKLLWKDNAMDCYIVKDNSLVGQKSARGPVEYICNEVEYILGKLDKAKQDGFDLLGHFAKATFK